MWNSSAFDKAESTAEDLGIPPWVFVLGVCVLVLTPVCYMWTCVRNGAANLMCLCNMCSSGFNRVAYNRVP